jgi:hypothetical protein
MGAQAASSIGRVAINASRSGGYRCATPITEKRTSSVAGLLGRTAAISLLAYAKALSMPNPGEPSDISPGNGTAI